MPLQAVRDLVDGTVVSQPLLVGQKSLHQTKNGKSYLALRLCDATGDIEARVWDHADHLDKQFATGDLVAVQGHVQSYQGRLQIVATAIDKHPDQSQRSEFLPRTNFDIDDLMRQFRGFLRSVKNPFIQKLLYLVFDEPTILAAFKKAPAAKLMHHAVIGGLLEHTVSLLGLVDKACSHYPTLNRDLLIAGACLHDIGKIDEFSYNGPFDYTDEGQLIGHIVSGSILVSRFIDRIDGFPDKLRQQLLHLILTHHGKYEFGSPQLPKTREAVALHLCDDLDSKMQALAKAIADVPANENWTPFLRQFDRRFLAERPTQTIPMVDKDGKATDAPVIPDLFK